MKINIPLVDIGRANASVVKSKWSSGTLAEEWTWKTELESIMVHHLVENWSKHVGENVRTDKVDRILNNYDLVFDPLMHEEGHDQVVVVQISLSEFDKGIINDWVKITIFSEYEVSIKLKLEILDDESYGALSWQDPGVQALVRTDLPLLQRGKIELNLWPKSVIIFINEQQLDVLNIELRLRVGDIGPHEVPVQKTEAPIEIIGELGW